MAAAALELLTIFSTNVYKDIKDRKIGTVVEFFLKLCANSAHEDNVLHIDFVSKSILRPGGCCVSALYSHIVIVRLGLVAVVNAARWEFGTQLYACISTADKICLLLSMTDFEFMTPH